MSLLTEYDSTVIASQTIVALQGGGGGGGGNTYVSGNLFITASPVNINGTMFVTGTSNITASTVTITGIVAGQNVNITAGTINNYNAVITSADTLLVTGAISGLSTLAISGGISGASLQVADITGTSSLYAAKAEIENGLTVSTGTTKITGSLLVSGPFLGFFGGSTGLQTVTSNDGVTGIMAALEAYGLIISAGNA